MPQQIYLDLTYIWPIVKNKATPLGINPALGWKMLEGEDWLSRYESMLVLWFLHTFRLTFQSFVVFFLEDTNSPNLRETH